MHAGKGYISDSFYLMMEGRCLEYLYVEHRVLEVQYRDEIFLKCFCKSYFVQLDNEFNILYSYLVHK